MDEKITGVSDLPVLIIDDVPAARLVLSDMLRELGFDRTIQARNGCEALEILKRTPAQLILCDFLMEGMNGLEFLDHLNKHHSDRNPPVIFVSSLGDVSTVETAMGLGATDYLVKPVSFRKLKRKIEHALATGYCLPDSWALAN